MRVQMIFTGTSALMMHNERLSDPADPIVIQIKELTSKGTNQTDSDRATISKLEWRGGIYVDAQEQIIVPTANVVRCLREAATITKDGKNIARGLHAHLLQTPLETGKIADKRKEVYSGLERLASDPSFIDRRQVKVGRGRISRTRPIFPRWGLTVDFELLDDVMNMSKLANIASLAGRAVGLCDARILGYGRFTAEIKVVSK